MVALAIKRLPNKRRTDFPKHVAKRQMSYGRIYTSFDELKSNIEQWIYTITQNALGRSWVGLARSNIAPNQCSIRKKRNSIIAATLRFNFMCPLHFPKWTRWSSCSAPGRGVTAAICAIFVSFWYVQHLHLRTYSRWILYHYGIHHAYWLHYAH